MATPIPDVRLELEQSRRVAGETEAMVRLKEAEMARCQAGMDSAQEEFENYKRKHVVVRTLER